MYPNPSPLRRQDVLFAKHENKYLQENSLIRAGECFNIKSFLRTNSEISRSKISSRRVSDSMSQKKCLKHYINAVVPNFFPRDTARLF